MRVWRLGNAAPDVDMLFALEGSAPASARPEPGSDARQRATAAMRRNSWLIGGAAVGMAITLVADGLYEGYLPGGRSWTTSSDGSGWIVYVFAAVVLAVAARAVHGPKLALRVLIGIALILFIERSFTPFSMREQDPIVLALHGVGAFASLALALVTASVIRGPTPNHASVPKLEAA